MKRACTSMHLSQIVIGYGMTETSPASFASATDDTLGSPTRTMARSSAPRYACATARVPRPKRSGHSVRARSPITGCRVMSKFVDGFPTTVTGKVRKFLMRQQMIDELGLSLQETA